MENKRKFRPDPHLKLMDQVRQVLRYHHYAYRTENTYCDWIVRYIKYFGAKKHPRDMGKTEIDAYLSHLATERKVSASTQRQALNAIIPFDISSLAWPNPPFPHGIIPSWQSARSFQLFLKCVFLACFALGFRSYVQLIGGTLYDGLPPTLPRIIFCGNQIW